MVAGVIPAAALEVVALQVAALQVEALQVEARRGALMVAKTAARIPVAVRRCKMWAIRFQA